MKYWGFDHDSGNFKNREFTNELTHYLWEKSESEEAKMPEVFSMKMSLTRKMEIRKMTKMKLAQIRLFLGDYTGKWVKMMCFFFSSKEGKINYISKRSIWRWGKYSVATYTNGWQRSWGRSRNQYCYRRPSQYGCVITDGNCMYKDHSYVCWRPQCWRWKLPVHCSIPGGLWTWSRCPS